MAFDGFRVNLGKPAQGADLKTMVSERALTSLLHQARQDPSFQAAKGEYEFRLRKLGGEAVLELRRPTTGFFAKIWGGGRRSAERSAAHEALRLRLPELSTRKADAGALRKTEARSIAAEALRLDERKKNGEAHLDIVESWNTAKKDFDVYIDAEGDSAAIRVPLPHAFTKDFINRGVATMKDDKLVLEMNDNLGNDHAAQKARLDMVESFIDRTLSGVEDREGARDALKKNLLSFVMQGNSVFHLENMNKALSSESIRAVDPGSQTFDFNLSIEGDRVVIQQRWETREGKGMRTDIKSMAPDVPLPEYKSKLVFSLPISGLIRADFDPASAQVISADWGIVG